MEGPANRNIPDTRYSEWLPTYEAALLELDPAKLKERVKAAHAAINRRMKAMAQDHGGRHHE